MPTISAFFGFVVQMYWREHPPAHIHVYYQGVEVLVGIQDGAFLFGDLPRGAKRLIRAWVEQHRQELLDNWERGRLRQPFLTVPGADVE